MYSYAVLKNCQALKYTNGYPKKGLFAVGAKSVVRGGGKEKSGSRWGQKVWFSVGAKTNVVSPWGQKSLDLRSRDFCPNLEPRGELIAQYRPPMSFRF